MTGQLKYGINVDYYYLTLLQQPWGEEVEEDQGSGPPSLSHLCQRVIKENMDFSQEQVKLFRKMLFTKTLSDLRYNLEWKGTFPDFRLCYGNKHVPTCEFRRRNLARTSVPKLSALAADKVIDCHRPLEYYMTALYGPKSFALRSLETVLEAYKKLFQSGGSNKYLSCQGRRLRGFTFEEFEQNIGCPPPPKSDELIRDKLETMLRLMARQPAMTPKHGRIFLALQHHLESL